MTAPHFLPGVAGFLGHRVKPIATMGELLAMPIDRLLAKQPHASLSTPRQWPSRNLFSIHSTPALPCDFYLARKRGRAEKRDRTTMPEAEEKDAFERWLPVGLVVASVILVAVAGYEILTLSHVL